MFTSLFLRSLNREAASPKNRPGEILNHLEIREGNAVADLGLGGGFFTLAFAERVGKNGKVYAIDAKPKYLDFIGRRSAQEGLNNIVLVQVREMESKLPEAGLDLVFVRNAPRVGTVAVFICLMSCLRNLPNGPRSDIQNCPHNRSGYQVLMPQGFGLDFGGQSVGVNVNLFTHAAHRDPIAATPYHRRVPCRLEKTVN